MRAARLVALALTASLAGCVAASGESVAPPAPLVSRPQPAPHPAPAPARRDFAIEGAALEQGGWIRGRAPSGTARLMLGGEAVTLGTDGTFFAGFDRDAPGSLRLTATLADGHSVTRDLAIARRDWQIEHIDAPLHGSTPSAAFLAIRRPELAAIHAARDRRVDSDGWTQPFIWPVKGRISGRFGSQRVYQGVAASYHTGLDIATGTSGTPYVAPADGVVVLAAEQPFSLEGNLVIIAHGRGLNSAFLHASRLAVKTGDRVKQGQLIGYIGATGRATGPHLHWSLMWQDARLDPLLFLPPQP